jgi:hypothetical protein
MHEVQEQKITNASIRESFCGIPDIINIIQKCQMHWIGSIARMNTLRLPRKLIASWLDDTRKVGRPQSTFRNSFSNAIKILLPSVQPSLPLIDWIDTAAPKQWTKLINTWWKTITSKTTSEIIL